MRLPCNPIAHSLPITLFIPRMPIKKKTPQLGARANNTLRLLEVCRGDSIIQPLYARTNEYRYERQFMRGMPLLCYCISVPICPSVQLVHAKESGWRNFGALTASLHALHPFSPRELRRESRLGCETSLYITAPPPPPPPVCSLGLAVRSQKKAYRIGIDRATVVCVSHATIAGQLLPG
jgi:hypothetical protein